MTTTNTPGDSLLFRFLGGTIYTSLGTVLQIISGVVAAKILATFLPRTDFGIVLLIELVASFLSMISAFSIGVAVIRNLTHAVVEEQKRIVDTVVIFLFMTVVLVSPIFFLTQHWVYQLLGGESVGNLTLLVPVYTLVMTYRETLKQMLQGFLRFKQMALIELVTSILSVILLAIFLAGFKVDLVGIVLIRLFVAGMSSVAFYLALPTKKGLSFHYPTLIHLLRFSWALHINQVLTFFYNSFGTVMVATLMTPADVALLAVAGQIPSSLARLYESFRTVYFPNLTRLIAQGDWPRAQKTLNITLRMVVLLMILATTLALIFQNEIMLLFFSGQYLAAGPVFVLLMFSATIGLVGNVLGNSTVAAGNPKAPAMSNTVGIITSILGNLALVPLLGIIGVALSGIASRVLTNPANVWFLRKAGLIPKEMNYVKPILLFGALYLVFLWLQPESLLARMAFLPVFIVASFLFSIITLQDIRSGWIILERIWDRRFRKRIAPVEVTTES